MAHSFEEVTPRSFSFPQEEANDDRELVGATASGTSPDAGRGPQDDAWILVVGADDALRTGR
jgi:hypothetical protein